MVLGKKLWRVPWTARSNQSILKEISPEYSLEGLMLKLKLQYFGHLMQRTESFEKTLMLGKIEGRRRRGRRGWDGWMASRTWWTWVWVSSGSCWWIGRPGMLQSMGLRWVGHDNNRTELNWLLRHVISNTFTSVFSFSQWELFRYKVLNFYKVQFNCLFFACAFVAVLRNWL